MHAIVTGGAGFIGSTLVDRLRADGHRVLVVDDLSRGRESNLTAALDEGGTDLEVLDLRYDDPTPIFTRFAPEVVFHLAAQIDVRVSVDDPAGDASTNILGTIAVARAAVTAGTRKVVFASSGGAIYGSTAVPPVAETTPVAPVSPYACSKVGGEMYLDSFRVLQGLDCSHIAPANVYGPRQDPHGEAGVVAVFARAMLDAAPTTLFGDGGNTRDYVYVDDVVEAFVAASGTAGSGMRFNIGTGVETSDRDLHAMVARATGYTTEPQWQPARSGDVRRSALDAGLARKVLGWSPRVDLAEGIARTVDWFRAERGADALVGG
ncbi:UDP-glucose 4-epimerase [Rhodococcus rhodochrous J3]|uniref:UDP-glucose 4-epimerase n=1 Tax=Rhodococcus rhodochrous J3 TaxID=903528 RepID=A0ABY1MA63_RHORH|nr:NAD-dependent epimerase/dehydratase family protein [Rhodococcus rhodochrous]MBF4481469.1 NAD-dependent epimerase/dehydratase family protein [Rhodococcus rhodochrous]SMG31885.1 UDP-glucose 4-epimerase [Rhodococcus rhodochrous J3]